MLWSRLFIPTLREPPPKPRWSAIGFCCARLRPPCSPRALQLPVSGPARDLEAPGDRLREEMGRDRRAGVLPAGAEPAEIWQESGRYDVMATTSAKLKDRFGRALCLGMTHERVMYLDRPRRTGAATSNCPRSGIRFRPVPRRAASQVGPACACASSSLKDKLSFDLARRRARCQL